MNQTEKFFIQQNIHLNQQQMRAVSRIEGQTLLLAVPGSGKTTVIICRIAYMIREKKIPPQNILTLTFSRASAKDLNLRYRKDFGEVEAEHLHFSTIHSFALSIIRTYERMYKRKAFDILENNKKIISDICRKKFNTLLGENELAEVNAAIGFAKNMMLSDEEIEQEDHSNLRILEIIKSYDQFKLQNHLMDFDDLLKYAWLILKKNQALLKHFQKKFSYINVDETQDTSKLQYEILYLLTGKNGNLFMVGDEDQSIYGFRGAWPEGLLNFKAHYPKGEILLMEINYRSSKSLVSAANQFIKINTERYKKNMRTENGKGIPAVHEYVKTQEAQYPFILKAVQVERKETAVLFRNNDSAIPLADLFEEAGEPYYMREKDQLFFTHFMIKDIRLFSAFAEDPTNIEIFSKIFYKVSCGISRKEITLAEKYHKKGQNVLESLLIMTNYPKWKKDRIADLAEAFEHLKKMKPAEALDYIYYDMGYCDHLEYRIENGARRETLDQKWSILKTIAKRVNTQPLFFDRLDRLQWTMMNQKEKALQGVTFSTIHAAKGLEFDKVFMIDVIQGIFPVEPLDKKDENSQKLYNEEVRLFYVGVTRARKELIFISVKNGKKFKRHDNVSEFIKYYMKKSIIDN